MGTTGLQQGETILRKQLASAFMPTKLDGLASVSELLRRSLGAPPHTALLGGTLYLTNQRLVFDTGRYEMTTASWSSGLKRIERVVDSSHRVYRLITVETDSDPVTFLVNSRAALIAAILDAKAKL